MADRAQSEVLGYVLLVPLVLGVASMIVVQGGPLLTAIQHESQTSDTQQVFSAIDHQATTVALGDDKTAATELEYPPSAHSGARTYTEQDSHITITASNPDNDTQRVLLDRDLYSLTYQNNDATVAYQAGGVFTKERGANHSRVVSSPEFDYRQNTLTLPAISFTEEKQLGTQKVRITSNNTTRANDVPSRIEAEEVTITIHSAYYQAWGDYWKNDFGGDTSVAYDHANETVSVTLGNQGDVLRNYNDAITSTSTVERQANSNINGSVTENANLQPLDSYIGDRVSDAQQSATNLGVINSNTTLSDGHYYADSVQLNNKEELTLNAQDDNITLVVDGTIDVSDNATIVTNRSSNQNSKTHAEVFLTNNLRLGAGSPSVSVAGNDTQSEGFRVYGTSRTDALFSQGSSFEGVVYAPTNNAGQNDLNTRGNEDGDRDNDEGNEEAEDNGAYCQSGYYDVCVGSNAEVTGSLVVGETRVGNGGSVNYDDGLSDSSVLLDRDEVLSNPELYHLHASVNYVNLKQ